MMQGKSILFASTKDIIGRKAVCIMKHQESLSQRELAQQRIRERRRRQAAKRRRRRKRLTLAAVCLCAVLLCAAVIHFLLPEAELKNELPTNQNTLLQGAEGPGNLTPAAPEENYDHVDITPQEEDSEELLALKELAVEYPRVKKIIDNIEAYPEELIALVLKNQETVDYVADYPEKSQKNYVIDLSKEAASSTVPLLLQWDERWGYEEYGSGLIGWTGCGPTCMSMLTLYLTGNDAYDPATVARWAKDNGYYSSGSGTAWLFFSEGSAHFGLRAEELPLVKQYIVNALDEGRPVVCAMGPGDFTTNGHYIILTGYDDEGFTVNDPNSPIRSSQHWTYETLERQISNLWAMSKA